MAQLKPILGFVLVGAGVLIIGYALYSSLMIFKGKNEPPQIFSRPLAMRTAQNQEAQQAEALLQDQLKAYMPPDAFARMLNLVSWSILSGVLILGGGQMAGIGVKLLKP
ncbi:MAG: hypothetical protein HYV77_02540 [Candidatus Wildermuthbacteria bacterium]|nr:hypothetical protein [Candidatus Wildermuthbacteria bacterium]